MGGPFSSPCGLGLAEGSDLYLNHSRLSPDNIEVRSIGYDGIIRVHSVSQKVSRPCPFTSILFGLPCPDWSPRYFSHHRCKNQVAFKLYAAFF